MYINKIQADINFQSTSRRYKNSYGDEFGCNSWLFRDDLDWEKLTKYESTHFLDKDKVNIVMFASSDGSEAYTQIISLYEYFGKENTKKLKKFLPIQAYDIDSEILSVAKSGYIKTYPCDRIELQIHTENYQDYFEPTDKKLFIPNDTQYKNEKIFKAKPNLTQNVQFNYGDMFKKIYDIKDNSNTILMCRNILGYLINNQIEKFINSASQVLKSGSLLTIGNHDFVQYNIKNTLEKFGFKEIMKNVYKRI